MVIKYEQGKTVPDILKTLESNMEINDFIDSITDKSEWVMYVNSNFFTGEKINNYKDIEIIYNDFIPTDNLIILYDKKGGKQ